MATLTGAACAGVDTSIFFPEEGGSTEQAKSLCRGCPVRDACLQWAMATNQAHGVLGGYDEKERRALRRSRSSWARSTTAGMLKMTGETQSMDA